MGHLKPLLITRIHSTPKTLIQVKMLILSHLIETDVNTFFLALREQIIQSYFNKSYQNLSENYYKRNLEENKQQVDHIDGDKENNIYKFKMGYQFWKSN